jgi:hypothetical protein
MKTHNTEEIVTLKFIELFSKLDFGNILDLLTDDVVAHITNFEGGEDIVTGRHNYLTRLNLMDIRNVDLNIKPTQLVTVEENMTMVMVEVQARKNDMKLHNHATHLLAFKSGKIKEIWMVEALPEESAKFWL